MVGTVAKVKGNLFSAKGQVAVEYLPDADSFLAWWGGHILVAAVKGGLHPDYACTPPPVAVCFGSEIKPVPAVVRQRANAVVTIPQYGKAPCLTADQAMAIVLFAMQKESRRPS